MRICVSHEDHRNVTQEQARNNEQHMQKPFNLRSQLESLVKVGFQVQWNLT